MECEKMNKEKNISKVSKVSKIKLNVNFVCFIEKVIKEKLMSVNKEKLREIYLSDVRVKSYRNILRVSDRVMRDKLREILMSVLKEKNISFEEFENISKKVSEKIVERKVSNYISLEE